MKRWEYKVLLAPVVLSNKFEREINDLGQDGWELAFVTITQSGDNDAIFAFLKRESIERAKTDGERDFLTSELRSFEMEPDQ